MLFGIDFLDGDVLIKGQKEDSLRFSSSSHSPQTELCLRDSSVCSTSYPSIFYSIFKIILLHIYYLISASQLIDLVKRIIFFNSYDTTISKLQIHAMKRPEAKERMRSRRKEKVKVDGRIRTHKGEAKHS